MKQEHIQLLADVWLTAELGHLGHQCASAHPGTREHVYTLGRAHTDTSVLLAVSLTVPEIALTHRQTLHTDGTPDQL